MEPPVRDEGYVVVWWDGRIEHGDCEGDGVFGVGFVLGVALEEEERVVVEDDFAVDVFDDDPKGFGASVDFFVPAEIGGDGEFDAEERAGDGLNLGGESGRN